MRGKSRRFGRVLHRAVLVVIAAVFLSISVGAVNSYAYENTVGIVKEGGARIRSASSTDSTVLASVVSGNELEICGMETGADGYTWYKVYVDRSTIGYIRSDLITDTGEKTGGVTDNNITGGAIGGNTDTPQDNGSQDAPQDNDVTDVPQDADTPDDAVTPEDTQTPGDTTTTPVVTGAFLQSIGLGNNVSMTPVFSPDVTEYTIYVDENTTAIAVFGVAAEGAAVTENYGFSDLQRGSNMGVITVQAADGSTRSYYFTVNRGEASAEIHYSEPPTIGGEDTDEATKVDVEDKESKGGNTGWIVFLVIVIIAMAAVIVLMGLRIRDYRRELYGEDPEEFHIKDALPGNNIFQKIFEQRNSKNATRTTERKMRVNRREEEEDLDDDDVYEDEAYDEDEEDEGFMYDIRKTSEDAAQIQDPGMRYHKEDMEDYDSLDDDEEIEEYDGLLDIDTEDDELEDIMERNATITDHESGKEVWKSVNFMTPADDLEFEFIELEDENE